MKWFRIATAGQTTDGREIAPEWIEQMAQSYDPAVYGARINVEHMRGFMPDGDFGAYGDVVALKSDTVSVNGEDKLALFAQIKANDKLKALNAKNQKIYTSVEIDVNFAKTGKAYLVGLAVTDSPASLGTEMLTFAASASQNPLAARKLSEGNLFTAAVLTEFDFNEPKSLADSIVERISHFFAEKAKTDDAEPATDVPEVETLADEDEDLSACFDELCKQFSAKNDDLVAKMNEQFNTLNQQIKTLSDELEQLAMPRHRPQATGGDFGETVDC